tara:strand:+ start:73 stop:216 length:144 start_codon:yes stop_codon:yes gene_type:complete
MKQDHHKLLIELSDFLSKQGHGKIYKVEEGYKLQNKIDEYFHKKSSK